MKIEIKEITRKTKEAFIKGWKIIEGKKLIIAALLQSGLIITHWVAPTAISVNTYNEAQELITLWTMIALGDKVRRNEEVKKWMEGLSGKAK